MKTWKGLLAGAIVSGIIGGTVAKADDAKKAGGDAPPAAEATSEAKESCGKETCAKDAKAKESCAKKDHKKKKKSK